MDEREKIDTSAGALPLDPELRAQLDHLPPQDENGVDLSMIDLTLSMSGAERIERHYHARLFVENIERLRMARKGEADGPAAADFKATA